MAWHNVEANQMFEFVLQAEIAMRLREWRRRIVGPLEDLLTFATQIPSSTTQLKVNIPDQATDRWIEVLFRGGRPPVREKPQLPTEMLFTYRTISTRFEDVLHRWLAMYDTIGPVIRLLLGILHECSSFLSTEMQFLSAVQAVESYHHGCRPSPKRKLLALRLADLINECSALVAPLLSDRLLTTDQIADARNYLSHLNPKDKHKRLGPSSLLDARDILCVLLQTLFLHDLGFTVVAALEQIRTTRLYRNIGMWKSVGLEPDDDGLDW